MNVITYVGIRNRHKCQC